MSTFIPSLKTSSSFAISPRFFQSKRVGQSLKLVSVLVAMSLTACATQHASQNYERPIYVNGVPSIYVVQSGDTLSHIATRYRLNYRKIAALNGLDSNYTIYTGQRLRLFATNGQTQPTQAYQPPVRTTSPRPSYTPPIDNNTPVYTPTRTYTATPAPIATPTLGQRNWLSPVNGSVARGFASDGSSKGIWYTAQAGAPVTASQAGTVLYAGDKLTEYGNLIMIRHDSDYVSAYTHLGQINVNEGQVISGGQQIGTVGVTNGQPMMEFQIRYRGTPVNPANYLK